MVAQLCKQQVAGVPGAVLEYVIDREELRLVVHNHAGIRSDGRFAVSKGIEGVYGLVRRDIVRQVDEDFHLVGGHILNLLDFDFVLLLGLYYGVNEQLGGLAVRELGDGDGALVDFLDAGTHLHYAAPAPLHIFGAVGEASCREVGIDFIRLSLQDGDGSVDEFVEVVGQNLGGHTHTDTFGTLCEQQRETDRELGRLLVASVVAVHPVGDFRVENHLLGKFAQPCLYVTRSSVGITCEDVSPVTLAIHGKAFLSELHECTEYGSVSVGMVLHSLADYVRHLGICPVIHPVHSVEHTPLHRLQTVHNMRHGPVQDDIGRIVKVPVLEHSREPEFLAVALQEFVELPGRFAFCRLFCFQHIFLFNYVLVFFAHLC